VLGAFLVVLLGNVLVLMLLLGWLTPRCSKRAGLAANYLKPMLVFRGARSTVRHRDPFATAPRRAGTSWSLAVAIILLCMFFLWQWTPDQPTVNRVLMFVDPARNSLLRETWLRWIAAPRSSAPGPSCSTRSSRGHASAGRRCRSAALPGQWKLRAQHPCLPPRAVHRRQRSRTRGAAPLTVSAPRPSGDHPLTPGVGRH
jgi:hypothetical protein